MVKIHINFNHDIYINDTSNTQLINDIHNSTNYKLIQSSKYVNEHQLVFKTKDNNVYVTAISNEDYNKQLLKNKARKQINRLYEDRIGKYSKDNKEFKKNVSKHLYNKYISLKKKIKFELLHPFDVRDNMEQHKPYVEMYSSGCVQIVHDKKLDDELTQYFKLLAREFNITPMTADDIKKIADANKRRELFSKSYKQDVNI